jgi:enoyl-CoA hydratase/carnithine racemase
VSGQREHRCAAVFGHLGAAAVSLMTAAAPAEKRITTEARGHVLLIGLSRPAKLNAFDPQMLEELAQAYSELENGPHRCGVLFAHGEHFTAGLDLAKVAPVVMEGKGLFPTEGMIDPFGLHGKARTKPVVCAVHGRCLTLGIELVLASDITIAADDTKFAQIEVKRGIFPFGGATLRWVQASGWGTAMRWLLTGDELGAEEALRIGLVQEVAARGTHLEKAIAIAETIAAQAPLGVQATLASARMRLEKGFEPAANALVPQILSLMGTEDAREGMMSFLERRTAKFEGR